MATKVLLPKFGQTVETSEIVQWTKQEGQAVKKGDILCEIATDKSSLEVESQYEGTLLKILLPPGKTAPVNCVMALIGAPGEALSDALIAECLASQAAAAGGGSGERGAGSGETAAPAPAPAPIAPPAPVPAKPAAAIPAPRSPLPAPAAAAPRADGRIFVSPRARKLAETSHVALSVLAGSGENGRIVEHDVRDYLRAVGSATPAARVAAAAKGIDLRLVKGSGSGGRIGIEDLLQVQIGSGKPAKKAKAPAPALVAKTEKPSPMRKAIAANMLASASTIPAFQLEITVDAASLMARRESDKAAGFKISFGDYIARAVGLAIRRFPAFAATWTDQGLVYRDGAHVGFAVAIPGGLIVPVVPHCDSLTPADIAAQSAVLVEKARTGKLAPEEYSGGVFTLSNLGAFPVDRFVAIVPPGQSGIIAIGRIRDEVVIKNGGFFAAKQLSLTLSADHRYIDGAEGAAFMTELKGLLEDAAAL